MFGAALATERAAGLNMWDADCPPVEGMHLRVGAQSAAPALAFASRLERPAQAVDQRLKIPTWMAEFTARGGTLQIGSADLAAVEQAAASTDLVIIATGKGALGSLFARNDAASPYAAPQRTLAASCVTGYVPAEPFDGVCFNLIPGVGEYIVMPGLTVDGPCHFMILEARPGGPLDCWAEIRTTEQHMAQLSTVLAEWLPWEHARSREMRPTDANAAIRGRFAPTVRHPVGVLPSGAAVLGLADAVVLNDPITGQGSNNAARAATLYAERIRAHGDAPFDRAWMEQTFAAAWAYAGPVTGWTNAMLQPPPPHVEALLGAATTLPAVAAHFVNGFDRPDAFAALLADPAATTALIAAAQG